MAQLEGRNPVLEALRSGRPLSRIMMSKDVERHSNIAEIISLSKKNRVPLDWVTAEVLKGQAQTHAPQGVIAFASAKNYLDIHDLFAITEARKEPAFYVMLDGIEDPHNLGAIIRTANAAGVHGIIIPEHRAVGLTDTVAKVSAGAVEYVPVAKVNNLNNAIRTLKDKSIWVIGIDQNGSRTYTDVDFKLPTALVIGGEGKGISKLVKENCDDVAGIPMKGKISSLNASAAAAVVMYEVERQRRVG